MALKWLNMLCDTPNLSFFLLQNVAKSLFQKVFSVLLRMRQLKKVLNNFIVLKVRLKLYHVIIALQETWIEWTKCNFFFVQTYFICTRKDNNIFYSVCLVSHHFLNQLCKNIIDISLYFEFFIFIGGYLFSILASYF